MSGLGVEAFASGLEFWIEVGFAELLPVGG